MTATSLAGSGAEATTDPNEPLLVVEDLVKHFPPKDRLSGMGAVRAVDGVNLSLRAGETVGLVGESGCGKSTLGRTIVRLLTPTSGTIRFEGQDITTKTPRQLRAVRREMQMVFQDPFASLNPRYTVQEIIEEPFRIHGMRSNMTDGQVGDLLEQVGLSRRLGSRFPHEFSGGQRQRIAVARALALKPKLLILDEPVSALDVSVQAQIVNLLKDLQRELDLAYLFISHDLSVVDNVCDRIAVMYLGRIVEEGARAGVFERPSHPYTQALLSAIPIDDPRDRGRRRRIVLEGDVPNPSDPPSGCRFRTRCWKAEDICAEQDPPLQAVANGASDAACHFAEPRQEIRPGLATSGNSNGAGNPRATSGADQAGQDEATADDQPEEA